MLATGGVPERKSVLWMTTNILLNSPEDLLTVVRSKILSSVALACRDKQASVKKEAIYLVGNMIINLSE